MKGFVHAELFDSANQLLASRDARNFLTIEGRNAILDAFFNNKDSLDVTDLGWGCGVYLLNPAMLPQVNDSWSTWHSPVYNKSIAFNYDNIVLASFAPSSISVPTISSDMIMPFDFIPSADSYGTQMDTISGIFLLGKFPDNLNTKLISVIMFNTPIVYAANTQLRVTYTLNL